MSNKIKKYQSGGNLDSLQALRSMQQGISQQDILGKLSQGESALSFKQNISETQEKMEQEVEDALEELKRKQKKSGKIFKKLKFLDFIPGGKWLKTAIKGATAFDQAQNMKSAIKKMKIGGYGNSIFEAGQDKWNTEVKKMASDVSPASAMMQSIVGDIVGGKMGETFSDAFGNMKLSDIGKESVTPVHGVEQFGAMPDIPGMKAIDLPSDVTTNLKFTDTPWRDQFKDAMGMDVFEGGWKDIFKFDEGSGHKFLDILGLGESEEGGLFGSKLFLPSSAEQGWNMYGGGYDTNALLNEYIASNWSKRSN